MKKSKGNGFSFFMVTALFVGIIFSASNDSGEFRPKAAVTGDDYIWPVPDSGKVISEYTEETKGIEIVSDKEDSEVVATREGIVIAARTMDCEHIDNYPEYCCNSGLGNYVKVQHEDGTYALYAHLKYGSVAVVEGQSVNSEDIIGIMGSSGRSKQTHLYFQLCDSSKKAFNNNKDAIKYKYKYVPKASKTFVVKEVDNKYKVKSEDGLNFRTGAGTDNPVIELVNDGTSFYVTETKMIGDTVWGKATINGNEGWISLKYTEQVMTEEVRVEDKRCFLKLNSNNEEVSNVIYEYTIGEQYGTLEQPEKDGYIFVGWFTQNEGGVMVNENDIITEDTELFARWSAY